MWYRASTHTHETLFFEMVRDPQHEMIYPNGDVFCWFWEAISRLPSLPPPSKGARPVLTPRHKRPHQQKQVMQKTWHWTPVYLTIPNPLLPLCPPPLHSVAPLGYPGPVARQQ